MQEPSSPLAPLDPSRLQQQMQQPMSESVNRSMSSSSIGSIDSATSLNQFSCSNGTLADNVQPQIEFSSQMDVRQWSLHETQQKIAQQGCLVGHSFKPSSQENTMASLSSPASTHYSTVPNSPMTTGHNPGTPSNQVSQFSHVPQHVHNNQNIAAGGQLIHQQYNQQQQALPHNYQHQQMIFAQQQQQHRQRNPAPSQQQVVAQINSPGQLNAGNIHNQQHLVRQQSSIHPVHQNANQQFYIGQDQQQQQQRFIVQVSGGRLMRPQMAGSSAGQPATVQNSIVNVQGAIAGLQNQQHLAPSSQQFAHQLSPRQLSAADLQQKTAFAVGGQQQIIINNQQQQPSPLQQHQNFVQNQQKLINNQQKMQQISFVERPNLQTQQNFRGAIQYDDRMLLRIDSVNHFTQEQLGLFWLTGTVKTVIFSKTETVKLKIRIPKRRFL
uniref:Uncharacterized protein n=1 Tax=Romanomermis culicivorax TaxID=13658 RepID=A0A915KAR0_ROMCU